MIELNNINYKAGNSVILENINLQLDAGDFASIIGPNGAGKSTLIKIILGLIRDFEGSVTIQGIPHNQWLKQNFIGYVPQKEQFNRDFPATATDIVLMGLAGKRGLFKSFTRADRKLAYEKMELTGIYSRKNQYIGNLSGGEFQRVILARALVCEPPVLILDEPEAGVDREGVVNYYQLLDNLNKTGVTILTVSHDIHNTSKYCNLLICLNKTLHCHTKPELVNSEVIEKTFGKVVRIIERK